MSEARAGKSTFGIMAICFLVTVLEGYDLQVISSAGPHLQREMNLTPDQTGLFFSATLIGLAIGAILGGWIADRVGRKPTLVWSVAALGFFTLLTTIAPNFEFVLAMRILAGVGLGGALPTLIALVAEIAGGKHTTSAVTTIIVGQPLGGILSALVGRTVAESYGWPSLFLLGGGLTLLTVPIMLKVLPETKPAAESAAERTAGSRMPLGRALFGEGRAVPTVLLWAVFILTLALLSISLSWTPLLVIGKGFERAIGLNAIMAINAGGIAGGIVMSRVIDRYGVRWPMIGLYALMTLALYLFAQADTLGMLMVCAFLVGFGVLGAQFTLYGVSPQLYPKSGRGSAVGVAVAMGRIGSILGPLVVGGLLSAGANEIDVLFRMVPVALIAGIALFIMTLSAKIGMEETGPSVRPA